MAKGPNEAWKTNFTAIVDDNNPLEIHFFWAGKGSLRNPPALKGPLVSAISVTPSKVKHISLHFVKARICFIPSHLS